jgi:hypothetical protein
MRTGLFRALFFRRSAHEVEADRAGGRFGL